MANNHKKKLNNKYLSVAKGVPVEFAVESGQNKGTYLTHPVQEMGIIKAEKLSGI